jgi:hypothetical protein
MARPSKNTIIDYKSISIDVNGKVTGKATSQSKRSDNEDGFVYTASTKKNSNGKYEYNYEHSYGEETYFNKENPITKLVTAEGIGSKDMYRNIEEFRNSSIANDKNETVIDSVVSGSVNGYHGNPTIGSNFRYNEGNLGARNNTPVDGEDSFNEDAGLYYSGANEAKTSSFFQIQLDGARYGDQLEAARSLTE